jgi:hypothetical protein
MRALKGLVIGLGILIAIGLTVVLVTVFDRMGTSSGTATVAGPGASVAFGDVKIALPAGAKVLRTEVSNGRLIVHLSAGTPGTPGGVRVLVIDLASGKQLGMVEIASP